MKKFTDIKNQFVNGQNEFKKNIKDNVGLSINNNAIEPISQSISNCIIIENKIDFEMLHIDKLLFDARSILPRM